MKKIKEGDEKKCKNKPPSSMFIHNNIYELLVNAE